MKGNNQATYNEMVQRIKLKQEGTTRDHPTIRFDNDENHHHQTLGNLLSCLTYVEEYMLRMIFDFILIKCYTIISVYKKNAFFLQ